jgi:flagellar assembly factor FliW
MKVLTKAYGEIEIEERQRVSFPRGLFGFEELRDFVLLDATQQPFYWLQSTERVSVAFVLIDPKFFRPDYSPDVDPAELEEIGIASGEDMLVFSIVTIPPAGGRMTANLQGPLILNRETHVGRQSISANPLWGVRHGILEEIAEARRKVPQADRGST